MYLSTFYIHYRQKLKIRNDINNKNTKKKNSKKSFFFFEMAENRYEERPIRRPCLVPTRAARARHSATINHGLPHCSTVNHHEVRTRVTEG